MAKTKTAVKVRTCESCEEQDATEYCDGLGWTCEDCRASFNDLNDNETQHDQSELTEEDIDEIVALDENTEDGEYLDEKELAREGFLITSSDEDEYN